MESRNSPAVTWATFQRGTMGAATTTASAAATDVALRARLQGAINASATHRAALVQMAA